MSFIDFDNPAIRLITLEKTYIFAVGAVVTFFLNEIRKCIVASWNKRTLSTLEDYWLEIIPNLQGEGRQYSIGHFYFKRDSNTFRYDGKNYLLKDSKFIPYYEWTCKSLDKEIENKQILYVYSVRRYPSGESIKFGFGVSYIELHQKGYTFTNGFFLDALKDNLNIRSYKAINISKIAIELGIHPKNFDSINDFHEHFLMKYHNFRGINDEVKS